MLHFESLGLIEAEKALPPAFRRQRLRQGDGLCGGRFAGE